MAKVCVIKSEKPEVRQALEKIGFNAEEVESVVIKPSLCCSLPPETGATVDLRFLKQVLDIYSEVAQEIYIVENSYREDAEEIAERLGVLDLAEYYNARFVDLSRDVTIPVERDFIALGRGFPVPRTILKADVFINIGKMRTDRITTVALSLGNLFTLIPGMERFYNAVSDAIADVLMIRKPDLNIIDGIVAMEGNAPQKGRAKKMNLTLASTDPVAIDTVACHIMGINPIQIEHIIRAGYYGFGEYIDKRIEVVGVNVEDVRERFLLP